MKTDEEKYSLSVLVLSCDKYSDLWNPFFTLFFRYWPDCPYDIYLCTNEKSYPDERVTSIKTGKDITWSTTIKKCLDQIPYNNILLLQEDFLIKNKINTVFIQEYLDIFIQNKAACLRLYPSPPPGRMLKDNKGVGEILKGADYRVSLQAAIWDKASLYTLLEDDESAWDFESKGSVRSSEINKLFLSTAAGSRPIDYFSTAIVGGMWLRNAIELCESEGIKIDRNARKIETFPNYAYRRYIAPAEYKIKKVLIRLFGLKNLTGFKKMLSTGIRK